VVPGETGSLVAPGRIEALADALVALLREPRRCQALGVNARALAAAAYTWDWTTARIAERMRAELGIARPAAARLAGGETPAQAIQALG
jgi:glycosyltransferase involved in cell wall biosynthesis